jgi:hypothetical protein
VMLKKLTALAAVSLTLAGAGAGAALANHGGGAKARAHHAAVRPTGIRSILNAALIYLQIDRKTLVAGLQSGQSLAQIAQTHGKTGDGLTQAVVAAAKTALDKQVTAGRLTAAKEQTILAALQTKVAVLVAKTPPVVTPHLRIPPAFGAFLQPVLAYLKLDAPAVVAQLASGKTLAQIAVAQGGTAAGLTQAIVGSAKTQLDKAIAGGRLKLTAAQEQALLAKLQTSVAAVVGA